MDVVVARNQVFDKNLVSFFEKVETVELIWQKGRYSWIASLLTREIQLDAHFPFVEPPENLAILILSKCLLSNGGEAVVIPFDEEDSCSFLTQQGEVVKFYTIIQQIGERSECHANSAKLWKNNEAQFSLVTGYGLSPDGMWRRHSWVMDDIESLIETTVERVKYFGVRLSKNQADSFYRVYAA